MKNKQLVLPINMASGIGGYTVKLFIGSQQTEVEVLIDTGSSTLAIDLRKYDPSKDEHLETTTYAQDVIYGLGGWAGPVIKTMIKLNHQLPIQLNEAPIAITSESKQHNFQLADGIWGLAYHHLNKSYDVTEYLKQQSPALSSTFPWPFKTEKDSNGISAFKKYLRQFPEQDITPLFTAFEENDIVPNQFTLLTERSIEYVPREGMSLSDIAAESLNQGQMIIGQVDLDLSVDTKSIQVVHDAYYNTHLISIQVADFPVCKAPALDQKHINNFFSNSIIDSGCSFLILQKQLYQYVINCFHQLDQRFSATIDDFNDTYQQGKNYHNPDFKPKHWPDLTMNFAAPNNTTVTLSIPANKYWQQHAKGPNNWMFMLMNQLPQWPDQTICGLPLLNSYCCVFDRSNSEYGQIHWANINNP